MGILIDECKKCLITKLSDLEFGWVRQLLTKEIRDCGMRTFSSPAEQLWSDYCLSGTDKGSVRHPLPELFSKLSKFLKNNKKKTGGRQIFIFEKKSLTIFLIKSRHLSHI